MFHSCHSRDVKRLMSPSVTNHLNNLSLLLICEMHLRLLIVCFGGDGVLNGSAAVADAMPVLLLVGDALLGELFHLAPTSPFECSIIKRFFGGPDCCKWNIVNCACVLC
jgi:hypothetical protein